MIRFNCPSCGKPLSISEKHAGKEGSCFHCGKKTLIPSETSSDKNQGDDSELRPTSTEAKRKKPVERPDIEQRELDIEKKKSPLKPIIAVLGIGCGIAFLSICLICSVGTAFTGALLNETAQYTRTIVDNEFQESDQLWDKGKKAEAIAKYKEILEKRSTTLASDARIQTAYVRVIEFELEQGKEAVAEKLVAKALADNVKLSLKSEPAQKLVEVVQAKQETAAKEAKARKESESDYGGLVLLGHTVRARQTQIGFEVSGVVVNRRGRNLSYAQITFNIYDANGRQIGNAIDNINGLESGGQWKFEAIGVGSRGKTYKISDITGF